MHIGVLKEIKDRENRVGLTPAGAAQLAAAGHTVLVERGAGLGSGFPDEEYADAGAQLVDAAAAWGADLIVKVKEPLESEYRFLAGQIVFTYFHLAGVTPSLTQALIDANATAIAYETVEDGEGRLPLLAPMSGVAGSMAPTIGNYYLARFNGGRGMLLGRVLGQAFGRVLVIGDGVVGRHAARTAVAMGTHVTVAGLHPERLPELQRELSGAFEFIVSGPEAIAAAARSSDLVIGAVLVRGSRTPTVMTRAMVAAMQPGSVIVDVSIDQGGSVETSRPTSHSNPVYVEEGVIHYCVTNMPGAYPRTSTVALTTATLPFVLRLADRGLAALRDDPGLARGVNVHAGAITCRAVAEGLGRTETYRPLEEFLLGLE
ncbi:MAG: alanine dehydrogenase [Vicinamibacterales bacterium]